jgi:4-aminobutyrate aminotransferase / (S)-3-amino-2-methylpropionate transaminase / 5-aminovalerate transaminase
MIANVKSELPGENSKKYIEISKKYEPSCMNVQAPVVWDYGKGVEVTDVDGNKFIDFTSGVLVTNVGHSHPKHVEAIQEAASKLMNCYDFPTANRVNLAKKLVEKTPENLNKAFMLTTGSEATEAAMRISKRYKGKHEIISFYGAFHGRTPGAMSVGGKRSGKSKFGPMLPGAVIVPYPYCYRCPFKKDPETCGLFCLDFMETALNSQSTGDVAALIIEPYQGAGGFIFPPDGYLKRLEEWCKDNDIIFILDEVQSSFGRTGKLFSAEWEDLKPNMMCLGKGLGSGVPTSALLAESVIMDSLSPGEMSSTTGGNPLSCAAALAVLDIMEEENLPENARRIGEIIKVRLDEISENSKYIGDVRGRGLVMGIEFVEDKKTKEPSPKKTLEFINRCSQKGLLVGRVGMFGNVIRVAPPLVINEEEADEALNIIEAVMKEIG